MLESMNFSISMVKLINCSISMVKCAMCGSIEWCFYVLLHLLFGGALLLGYPTRFSRLRANAS